MLESERLILVGRAEKMETGGNSAVASKISLSDLRKPDRVCNQPHFRKAKMFERSRQAHRKRRGLDELCILVERNLTKTAGKVHLRFVNPYLRD